MRRCNDQAISENVYYFSTDATHKDLKSNQIIKTF